MRLVNFIKTNKWLIIIIGLALILRFVYLFLTYPPLSWFDSEGYDATAWNIVQGNGYIITPGIPYAGREPGYALFFLVPIYYIFDHSIFAVQIFQIIISIFIIIFTYLIARKILSIKMSLLSTFLITIWPPMIGYNGEIMTEIPFTFLLVLFLYILIKAVEAKSKKLFFFAGLTLGAATLTRFITFAFPFFLLVIFCLIYRNKRQASIYFLLILIGMLILVAPWMIRNYIIFDDFVLGRTGGGDIYWMGSYIPWDGEWFGYIHPFTSLCPKAKNVIAHDKCLIELTIENIKENPFGVGLVWLKKPLKVFLIPDGYDYIYQFVALFKLYATGIKGIYLSLHLSVIIMAILGLKDLFRKKRIIALIFSALFLYYALMLLPLNPVFRYNVPLMPLIAVLASLGLNNLYLLYKTKRHLSDNGLAKF